jgi:uncharacterized membrane protein (DUF441 family)
MVVVCLVLLDVAVPGLCVLLSASLSDDWASLLCQAGMLLWPLHLWTCTVRHPPASGSASGLSLDSTLTMRSWRGWLAVIVVIATTVLSTVRQSVLVLHRLPPCSLSA